jgi:DNA-binding transcriptional ArsR family regulator
MPTKPSKHDLSALQASAGQASALLKAVGNERRLLLLCLLIEHGELTAGELAEAVELSPSACSQHLAKMRDEGLVAFRRDAQTIHYRIDDPAVKRLITLLKNIYCK